MRILVAMSGGVDSSVAAALLKEQGYEVVGVTIVLPEQDRTWTGVPRQKACCSLESINQARRVCARLGIRHYLTDLREEFRQSVIRDFVAEYAAGRTPNPCVICNALLKWGSLLGMAESLGAELLATGHYARLKASDSGLFQLQRGVDSGKDQSYVLWRVARARLQKTLFPLGDLLKEDTRRIAAAAGLSVAHQVESQDVCFVPDDGRERFLREQLKFRTVASLGPGRIVDKSGGVIGSHRGAAFYTIGQRRGLGVATGNPLYVTHIDSAANTISVGPASEVLSDGLVASQLNWISVTEPPASEMRVAVKIRSRHQASQAHLRLVSCDKATVMFDEPQMAVTPGQSAVFYDGDVVLGGGIIEREIRTGEGNSTGYDDRK